MTERDPFLIDLDAEEDRVNGKCVVDIDLTLAGLQRSLVLMDNTGLVWDMAFCRDADLEQTRARFAEQHAVLAALNASHELHIAEDPFEVLRVHREKTIENLGRFLPQYRTH